MEDLRAKKSMKKYKNTNAWLDAVYRNNKETIDRAIPDIPGSSKKTVFKQIIKEYVNEGKTYAQATKTLARTSLFSTRSEHLRYNALAGLREDKEAYKIFRELSKEHGRYTKFDYNKLRWDKFEKAYVYDDRVAISYRNSPYGIVVTRL